jgi:hypothetical protein
VNSSAFRLTETERARRYDLLVQATALPEAPLLTEAALRLLLDLAGTARVPSESRAALGQLIAAGLAGSDGRLVPDAAGIVEVMRQPAIWLRIEAIAGQRHGTWKAWLSDQRAVMVVQSDGADQYVLQTAVPGWVPVAAIRWLGFAPRDPLDGRPVLPMATLLSWLDDPDTPLPGGDAVPGGGLRRGGDAAPGGDAVPGGGAVLAAIWAQPGRLWAIDVEPGGGRVLVLDAAEAGLWRVSADAADDSAALTPLPPRTFWRLLLTLIARASEAANAGQAAVTTQSDGLL